MKLTLAEVRKHPTIAAAIEARADESDSIASGIVGPKFDTSGPGVGYSRQYNSNDYARRAIEGGCRSYIDSHTGFRATLDDAGALLWSDGSVVELVAPDLEDVDRHHDAVERMVAALDSEQCMTTRPSDWADVRALLEISEAHVCKACDLELVRHGILYWDDASGSWYVGPRSDLLRLRILMQRDATTGYSLWCAECSHAAHEDEDEARVAAARE